MLRRVSTSTLYPPAALTSSPCVGINDVGPASCPVRLYPTQIMKYLTNMLSSKKKLCLFLEENEYKFMYKLV